MDLKGYSKRSLAKIIGGDRKSIRLWLKGIYYPKCEYLIKLSRCFKVRVDYLLGIEDGLEEITSCKAGENIQIKEVQNHLSQEVSAYMQLNHITRYKMAKMLGIDAKSMTKWLTSGSMPETGKLIKLSQVMGVSIHKLLGLE